MPGSGGIPEAAAGNAAAVDSKNSLRDMGMNTPLDRGFRAS
jgi:hypothetical protein